MKNFIEVKQKYHQLKNYFQDLEEVVVAYNGSVESTMLLKVAFDELGDEVIALMGRSESMSEREFENALFTAFEVGITPVVLNVNDDHSNMHTALFDYMEQNKLLHLIDSTFEASPISYVNSDNLEVICPLKELGFTYDEVCSLSKELGLSIWRRNYMSNERNHSYSNITSELLDQLGKAEAVLTALDFTQIHVRLQNDTLKIEVNPSEVYRFYEDETRKGVLMSMKELGFQYVSVDMATNRSRRKNVSYA